MGKDWGHSPGGFILYDFTDFRRAGYFDNLRFDCTRSVVAISCHCGGLLFVYANRQKVASRDGLEIFSHVVCLGNGNGGVLSTLRYIEIVWLTPVKRNLIRFCWPLKLKVFQGLGRRLGRQCSPARLLPGLWMRLAWVARPLTWSMRRRCFGTTISTSRIPFRRT